MLCEYIHPLGPIPFSHSPGLQLCGHQREDQQAGVIETSLRGRRTGAMLYTCMYPPITTVVLLFMSTYCCHQGNKELKITLQLTHLVLTFNDCQGYFLSSLLLCYLSDLNTLTNEAAFPRKTLEFFTGCKTLIGLKEEVNKVFTIFV